MRKSEIRLIRSDQNPVEDKKDSRNKIDSDVDKFLKSGKKITVIPNGQSEQITMYNNRYVFGYGNVESKQKKLEILEQKKQSLKRVRKANGN